MLSMYVTNQELTILVWVRGIDNSSSFDIPSHAQTKIILAKWSL